MKKSIMSFALALAFISCAEAQHSLTVKLSDIQGDTITVAVVDKEMRDCESQNKVVRTNGEFTYDFGGDKARLALITAKTAHGQARMQVYLVPGEQGIMTGATNSYTWSGTKFYQELAEYDKAADPVNEELGKLEEEYKKKAATPGVNLDSLQNAAMAPFQALNEKLVAVNMDYIKAHPANNVCATLLLQMEDPEAAMNLISADVKNGVFSDICKAIQAQIDHEKARKEAAKAVTDGQEAPDFTLNDINGKPLSLKSLRGKYLILDFWGSWCIWCIRGMPEMKKAYEKYKGKLEILGVDCNDTPEKWKAAVEKNQLPWKHVYNPKDSNVCTTYAIQGYPTKIIIDPQGKIVKTIIGEDPAFYTFLDELMK